jgi:pyruvate/2-oxoglutarate dehydrogenase complex dihydrolipoamide dehydrogenase (E3) component
MVNDVDSYDMVVIGSGQGGEALSLAFARAGHATTLIDDGQHGAGSPGATCTPSKALIASANVARLARRARDFGVETGTVAVDLPKVQRRRHAVIEDIRGGVTRAIHNTPGLTLLEGEASFADSRTLNFRGSDGTSRQVRANHIFINTGAHPVVPELRGLADVPYLDPASAMELDELPSHLLVLGGGDEALEIGQMFCRFGSRVSIVESQSRLLPREDRDVAATVAQILREDGVEVFLETNATSVEKDGRGGIRLQVRNPAGGRVLSGSHLMVVSGRAPNTDTLNLDAAGVAVDERGYIRVDDHLETSSPGIYALGDVNGGPPLAHVAQDDLRIVRTNLLENSRATTAGRICPYTVFIDPQLGRVGLTETDARQKGLEVRVFRLPMSRVARAIELNETRGFMKVVVEAASGRILGAAVLGVGGGEVMAMLQIAMMAGMPYTSLRDGMFAYPTLAESLNNLFTSMEK